MKFKVAMVLLSLSVAIAIGAGVFTELKLPIGGQGNTMEAELGAPPPNALSKFWGAETNHLKAGLAIAYYSKSTFPYFSDREDVIPIKCFPLLSFAGMGSDNVASNLLTVDLPMEPCYQLALTDEQGNHVQSTSKTRAMGKSVPYHNQLAKNPITGSIIDTGHRRNRDVLLKGFESKQILPLVLQDYFIITNSGTFNLSFKICVFIPDSEYTETEHLVWLPPVNCQIEIKRDP